MSELRPCPPDEQVERAYQQRYCDHALSDASYYDDDVILFSDNGEFTPDNAPVPNLFRYRFGEFQKTRQEANRNSAGVYSLAKAVEGVKNYGIALTGIKTDGSTVPVQVQTSVNFEHPAIADGSTARPAAMRLGLKVEVSGLESGVPYKLYRYNSMARVPDRKFNQHAADAAAVWDLISPGSAVVTESIHSDEIAVYRAVKASAR